MQPKIAIAMDKSKNMIEKWRSTKKNVQTKEEWQQTHFYEKSMKMYFVH